MWTIADNDVLITRQDRPRRFYRVGQKVRKNVEFFTISRLYVHISQKLLKIEAYKQRMEKSFISPLSKCRMCLDHRSRGSIGWAKKWATQYQFCRFCVLQLGRLAFLFSWASSSPVTYVGYRPPHILAWNHKNRARGLYRVGQKKSKISIFSP